MNTFLTRDIHDKSILINMDNVTGIIKSDEVGITIINTTGGDKYFIKEHFATLVKLLHFV